METQDLNKEIEEMRSQMALLNKKVESQAVINDNMIRRAMKSRMSVISNYYIFSVALCTFGIIYMSWFFSIYKLSIGLIVFTDFLFIAALAVSIYTGLKIWNKHLIDGNLIEAAKNVSFAKKIENRWLFFGIPMGLIFLVWFGIEFTNKNPGTFTYILWAAIFGGGIIGATVGLFSRHKMMKASNDIIQQIEQLTKEE